MSFRRVAHEFAAQFRLSPTEERVLELAAEGHDNASVAEVLGCARKTVGAFWYRILIKTGQASQRAVLAALLRFIAQSSAPPR